MLNIGTFWRACAVVVFLWPLQVLAQPAPLAVPELVGPLNDYAEVAGSHAASIEAQLQRVHRDFGVQFVVLTLPTLNDEPIALFAHRVMERYRLGVAGSDLGLLLLIVPNDRQSRFEVGYGLEGALPDALCKRLLADVLAPKAAGGAAQAKLSYANIEATVQAVTELLRQQQALGLLPKVTPLSADAGEAASAPPWLPWALLGGLIVIVLSTRMLMAAMPRYPDRGSVGAMGMQGGLGGRAAAGNGRWWRLLLDIIAVWLSGGGGRGGSSGGGGGYLGGGGKSGGGGASDRY